MNISAIVAMLVMIITFLIVSIFLFIEFYKTKNKTKGYKKVRGKCVDYNKVFQKKIIGDVGQYWKYPIVVYEVDNKPYQITSRTSYGLGTPLKNKKFTVFYNPNNPNDAILANQHRLLFFIFVGFSIGILCMLYFLINDIILDNTTKYYKYRVTCNVNGYVYNETRETEAKSKDDALDLIKEKYKNWAATCEYEEVNANAD